MDPMVWVALLERAYHTTSISTYKMAPQPSPSSVRGLMLTVHRITSKRASNGTCSDAGAI